MSPDASLPKPPPLIVTTGNEISGRAIAEYLGIACGLVVRSASAGQSFMGGVEKIFGGNITAYARLCDQARQDALATMLEDARRLKADAVIAFRYDATEFSPGVTEVVAYGTAVKLNPATE